MRKKRHENGMASENRRVNINSEYFRILATKKKREKQCPQKEKKTLKNGKTMPNLEILEQ